MNVERLRELLGAVESGALTQDDALERLRRLPFESIGDVMVDSHRALRTGQPEVVYAPGKTITQILAAARSLEASEQDSLITRLDADVAALLAIELPRFRYYDRARVGVAFAGEVDKPRLSGRGGVTILTAGSADIPVAEEAAVTVWVMGCEPRRVYDVGVAGIHRLSAAMDDLRSADAIIVVAGMEAALASVVGGLVSAPVIGVPTSVGYGASFGGVSALLSMLTSCAAGVTVVNIDNGFGGAMAAARIATAISFSRKESEPASFRNA